MSKAPRKRKTATTGKTKRRFLWGIALIMAGLLAVLAFTTPRQLPAIIADHDAVRTAYAWRDSLYRNVHNAIYPLALLREENTDPARAGVGYKEQDRDALDQLLKSKEGTTP